MPVTLAPLVGFALGVLLAWLSRTEPSSDEPWRDPSSLAVALYALIVFAPVTAYFAAFAGDWSFAYLIDARRVPSAVSLVLVVLATSALIGGFFAGRKALERRAPNQLAWLAAAPLAITVVVIAALHDRFGVDATYDQFTSDFGRKPLVTSPLGLAVLWMDGIVAAGAVLTARALSPAQRSGQTPPVPIMAATTPPTVPDEGPRRLLGQRRPSR